MFIKHKRRKEERDLEDDEPNIIYNNRSFSNTKVYSCHTLFLFNIHNIFVSFLLFLLETKNETATKSLPIFLLYIVLHICTSSKQKKKKEPNMHHVTLSLSIYIKLLQK